tara:strand:- start:7986 stop:8615 length:630 start_codon:yes stop_codon:yes gene_type:complete
MNKWDSNNLSLDELPRLKNLSRSDLEDGNKSVYDSIINSERGVGTLSDGSLPGPFNAWMHTDHAMAESLDNIGIAIRKNTSNVSSQMKELAICTIACHFRCNVEFWAHSKTAEKAGISAKTIESLCKGVTPQFDDSIDGLEQSMSYRLTKEYLSSYRVSDSTYEEALEVVGSVKGIVELVLVISHYVGLAAQLNILRVPNPGDSQYFEY